MTFGQFLHLCASVQRDLPQWPQDNSNQHLEAVRSAQLIRHIVEKGTSFDQEPKE